MPEMHVYFDLAFMSMENNLQKTHTSLPFYDKTSIEKGKKNQYQTQICDKNSYPENRRKLLVKLL